MTTKNKITPFDAFASENAENLTFKPSKLTKHSEKNSL